MFIATESMPFRYIRRTELLKSLGICRTTLEKLIAEGSFPAPFKIGARAVAWRSTEVEAAMEAMPRLQDAYQRSQAAIPRTRG